MSITITLIIQGLAFFATAWLVMTFGWPHINKAIEERQAKIASGLAAADRGQKDLEDAQAKAQEIIKDARTRASQIVDQAGKRSNEIVEEAKNSAVSEGERLITAARSEVAAEATRARGELRAQVSILAVKGAEQLLGREVNAQAHAALLDDLAAQIASHT